VRILLVVNSFASSVTPRNTVMVHRRLSRDHEVEVVETNRRGHATRFADDAARRGLDAVVAFGGDGTLNEVATGIAGTSTALGVLPGGSTNVFARTIGLENDPVAAADTLADALLAESIHPVGLGTVNGRQFCFHTGIGFDAAVVAAVERHASLKRWFGHPLFIWSSVSTWTRGFDRVAPNHSVATADGRSIDGAFLTVVLNSSPYTYLGNRPVDIAPSASLERPLVVVSLTRFDLGTLTGTFLDALRGRPGRRDGVVVWEDVTSVQVEARDADAGMPYQVDGDHLGSMPSLEVEFAPQAIRLVRPA
jgi:diacylglycerol kinase family enzyme